MDMTKSRPRHLGVKNMHCMNSTVIPYEALSHILSHIHMQSHTELPN